MPINLEKVAKQKKSVEQSLKTFPKVVKQIKKIP